MLFDRQSSAGATLTLAAGALALVVGIPDDYAWGQATSRSCGAEETVGPACLLAHQELLRLPSGPLYWHLDKFASKANARSAARPTSTIVDAFGAVWLFTIERKDWRAKRSRPAAVIGPLPVESGPTLAADYLRSVFSPA